MSFNREAARSALQAFDFRTLFINEVGWDQLTVPLDIVVDGQDLRLHPIAQKRGLGVYELQSLPDRAMRMKIERKLAKSVYEHILIFTNPEKTEQVWLWVRREPGKPLAQRQEVYRAGQAGEALVQKLESIYVSLEEEEGLTITDVTSRVRAAFDLERVTKRFYDQFKKEHSAFLKFIEGIPDAEWERWYASVMLNRLMFIYFVQKKGFLDGNQNYLRDKLTQSTGNFYHEFLCPLFFEGFAKKERDRSPEVNRLLGKIPYLNGGLFLKHQIEERYGNAIQIANNAFQQLFDYFDQYQWHLDERPVHADNEINPDVLGYIFEKYINQKQMGAYYTKEDITEYIARNTVIPYLFDQARQECRIAFEGEQSVWRLLQEDPDRYIYEAVKKGTQYSLPEDIAAGISDVAERDGWNTPAPDEYALPTEIWREVVARRQRYEDMWCKLVDGELQDINDLITYNLNIQQFAQDVIANSEGPELLRAFWKAINRVTVLDPTCGSGAFLFAALNILEPLYEACLERMEAFLAEPDRGRKYADFEEVIERIEQHPNRSYFILKSIIINNLYGVDIMAEAVEIAKLRLFLKLVAQLETAQRIEPLPDIDFNIRTGNTLVGFATLDQLKDAITNPTGNAPKLLIMPEDQDSLKEIEQKAQDVDVLFKLFRKQQTEIGGEVTPTDKAKLRKRLRTLGEELNRYLARQYSIDINSQEAYTSWLSKHQPFHWFIEFYGTLKSGGFNVVIGNPPYVEYNKVRRTYQVKNYTTMDGNNLYVFVLERTAQLLNINGGVGMILPIGLVSISDTESLRQLLHQVFKSTWTSNFAIRPAKLFEGVEQRLTIFLGNQHSGQQQSFSTKYHQWYVDERPFLFPKIEYCETASLGKDSAIPKLGSQTGANIVSKIRMNNGRKVAEVLRKRGLANLYFHRTPGYWIRVMDFEPFFKSPTSNRSIHHIRELSVTDSTITKFVGAALSSSLYFFWFFAVGNCRNLTLDDVRSFPIGEPSTQTLQHVNRLFDMLMESYRANSVIKSRGITRFQEFNWTASKPIVDEIDAVMAQHYGLSEEELDFIINYDIKIRMGDELFEAENDGSNE